MVRPDDLIDVSPGVIHYGRRPIRDIRNYGSLSFADVIVKSSNVGTSQIGVALGAARLNRYVRRFGFGADALPGLPGESRGIVHGASRLPDGDLARVAMGYNISVTPLQMAVAMNAVANGGEFAGAPPRPGGAARRRPRGDPRAGRQAGDQGAGPPPC